MGVNNLLYYGRATSSLIVWRRPLLYAYGARRSSTHSVSASRTRAKDGERKATDFENPAEATSASTSTSMSTQETGTSPGTVTATGDKHENKNPPGLIRKVRPFFQPQSRTPQERWAEDTRHSPQLHDYFNVLQDNPGTDGQRSRSQDSNRPVVKMRPRKDRWFWEFPVRDARTKVSHAVREEILNTIAKPTSLEASKEDTRFAYA